MSTACKYTEFVDAPGSTHNRVVELVPHGARVLEFGCATGYMTEVLKTRRGRKSPVSRSHATRRSKPNNMQIE